MQSANTSVNIYDILATKMQGILPEKVFLLLQMPHCCRTWQSCFRSPCICWLPPVWGTCFGLSHCLACMREILVFLCDRRVSALLQVVCSGHSLGAALASICAVWASVQYPNADVLSVTIGQARCSLSSHPAASPPWA